MKLQQGLLSEINKQKRSNKLSLTNNFYNKQFHQNKSIPTHMETYQNQSNSENATAKET